MRSCWTRYAPGMLAGQASELTPIGQDLSSFPPTLCIGTEYDVLLDDTLALYSELAAARVDVSLALWSGLTHGCLHYVGAVDSVTRAARSMLPFINNAGRGEPLVHDTAPQPADAPGGAGLASVARAVAAPRGSARRHGTLAQQLGIRILRGDMKPGELLPTEESASSAIGVSRSAYREAMRTLAAKGLIVSQPKVGTKVTPRAQWAILDPDLLAWSFEAEPDEKFIRDLFELRNTVEPTAAAMAAGRRSAEDVARLSEALARLAGANPGSLDSLEAEADFHRQILLASNNEALAALWSAIELTLRWSAQMRRMLPVHAALDRLVADHSHVFDRIAAQQAAEAQSAMTALIKASFDEAIANVRQVRRVTGSNRII